MENRLLTDAFEILKRSLRARGMTYAQVGEALGLSEVSVKRMFAQRDCKMSRLFELCELLELPPEEILQRARRTRTDAVYLPLETEAALAANPSLFHFMLLLRESFSSRQIASIYNLTRLDIDHYGRLLENLGLAELLPEGKVRLDMPYPVKIRPFGPLHSIVKSVNQNFLSLAIDESNGEDLAFSAMSRRMLPDTLKQIVRELGEFQSHIANLARQDQMIANDKELVSFKLTVAAGMFHCPDLLEIDSVKALAPLESS
ncbi:helix-turn-helix domain-containing protein [Cognatishimia activa]|uniref:HTH cro/C1-type domain-containing protein n=1 Tax=Cognatishimia activa TaxID=1715691 RepID=A0A0P1IS82_9RHOB|nr:helix-turn-helix domain-containing protein [Cognatishimia activa]CUI66403.1 hypothetical protein TA5113_01084 [Cognatishimia activa]CUK26447.1 hypothetical protein TA5114_02257 [Cognatishimia activa]